MTTVIYSEEGAEVCGFLTIQTWFGPVSYTCIVDEAKHGPWKSLYLWKDARVVAYADNDDLKKIRPVGPKPPEYPLAEFEEV